MELDYIKNNRIIINYLNVEPEIDLLSDYAFESGSTFAYHEDWNLMMPVIAKIQKDAKIVAADLVYGLWDADRERAWLGLVESIETFYFYEEKKKLEQLTQNV